MIRIAIKGAAIGILTSEAHSAGHLGLAVIVLLAAIIAFLPEDRT